MTLTPHASDIFLSQLAIPAIRALILAGSVGLALAAFRVKSPSHRLFTWTTVLYAALAMPFLGWILPSFQVPAPAFLQHTMEQTLPGNSQNSQGADSAKLPASNPSISTKRTSQESPSLQTASTSSGESFLFSQSVLWGAIGVAIYFAGAMILLSRILIGLFFTRKLLYSSHPIPDASLNSSLASRAGTFGLARIPSVSESESVSIPVTLGIFRPAVLIPANWREWDDVKLDAVIAHEFSHVTRRDALTQQLSLLHRAIFWFSPLAWWLNHHLTNLAEQASDEAVLSCGADRDEYARTLLGFFADLQVTPGRVWWQGVSMAKAGQAEQRLENILAWRGTIAMSLKKPALKKSMAALIVAAAVPAVYLAASVQPVPHHEFLLAAKNAQDQTPASAQSAPPATSTTAAQPRHGKKSSSSTTSSSDGGYWYHIGYGDDEGRFVIVSGKSDSLTMSGTTEDAHHAEKLRKQISGDFIWFERDEKSFVIRDQATIDRARAFWAPQAELGKQQEELGKQQEALGEQQEALGKKMEEVHVAVPDMTVQLDKLRAELKQLGSSATMEQMGQLQSEIGELQSKIGEIQSSAGEQQGKLGEEMGALGEKQGKLGEKQGELGRKQGELAKEASQKMKQLFDEAIKNGTAQPEPAGPSL